MELYTKTAYQLSEQLTKNYSTSFSLSSKLFDKKIRRHIYAIYGLVRVADEIVDTYRGSDASTELSNLLTETKKALKTGYSTNPIVHAFAVTAREFSIGSSLIDPFFESMKTDLAQERLDKKSYARYIYGSAEVVGLMCLRVFVNDDSKYKSLRAGAQALGSAYQKVNFLRDLKADYDELGRTYFPGLDFESFNDEDKRLIIEDIETDFRASISALEKLPSTSRRAVAASFMYYQSLLMVLKKASPEDIKQNRLSTSKARKAYLYLRVLLGAVSLKVE